MGLKALGSNIGRQGLIPKAGGGGGASTDSDAAAWFAAASPPISDPTEKAAVNRQGVLHQARPQIQMLMLGLLLAQ